MAQERGLAKGGTAPSFDNRNDFDDRALVGPAFPGLRAMSEGESTRGPAAGYGMDLAARVGGRRLLLHVIEVKHVGGLGPPQRRFGLGNGASVIVGALWFLVIVLGPGELHLGIVEESMHQGTFFLRNLPLHALHVRHHLVDGRLGGGEVFGALERLGALEHELQSHRHGDDADYLGRQPCTSRSQAFSGLCRPEHEAGAGLRFGNANVRLWLFADVLRAVDLRPLHP